MHIFKPALCISSLILAAGVTASTAISYDVPSGSSDTSKTHMEPSVYAPNLTVTIAVPTLVTISMPVVITNPAAAPVQSSPCSTGNDTTESPSRWISDGPETSIGAPRPSYGCNSTSSAVVIVIPTRHPDNSTFTSLASSVSASASETADTTTSKHKHSSTATPSASQTPNHAVGGSGLKVGNAIVGMGVVAGFMALL